MSKPSVSVENVSKKFGLTLKNGLKYGIMDSLRRAVGRDKDEELRDGEFWALSDVSFELNPGDALGIMGVNGSGKTTLLRILNGTYSPDKGKVTMRGRLGALIAAGAGFSPMLTGRENVFISGALMGMKTKEVRRRFDEIVAFSELGEFIDMPVRNYSSGMSVRLGFAVAVLGTPDVLLVDEVLAVGDISFQKKCYERIHKMRNQGTTILLVTHSIGSMWAVCNCGLFLNKGKSSGVVSVEDTGRLYGTANYQATLKSMVPSTDTPMAVQDIPKEYGGTMGGTGDAFVKQLEICSALDGNLQSSFSFREPLLLKMHVVIHKRLEKVMFRYSIDAVHYKYIFDMDSSYSEGIGLIDLDPGDYVVTTTIPNQTLRPGAYSINLAICQKELGIHVFFTANAGSFIINHPTDRFFMDAESPSVVYFDAFYNLEKIS
ncbi:MAG: ABC transporter ATP-binding protein [Desulfomicrobium sp.]|nr:ABC transporter ATP-binding protein [Desulfomicrobium sp.]